MSVQELAASRGLRRRNPHGLAAVVPAQPPAGPTASRGRMATVSARARSDLSIAGDRSGGTCLPPATAGPAGTTLQLLEQARASMGLPAASPAEPDTPSPLMNLRRAADRCWALLLVRIYECLPLRCPRCGEPMRIIAFVLDRPTVERILEHIGEPTEPPKVLPARSPPQLEFGFDQTLATDDWPEMYQTAGQGAGGWE